MAPLNILNLLSLCLLPTTLALPHLRPQHPSEPSFPTLALPSSAGVHPTGYGTGTPSYPTSTAQPPKHKQKRTNDDPTHPFGFPPPYQPQPSNFRPGTALPTASAPPSSSFPTGTALPDPSAPAAAHEVAAAKAAHRLHFEGPRRGGLRPFYPSVHAPGQGEGGAGPTGTGTGWPVPTGGTATGTGVMSLFVPMPTGASGGSVSAPTGASGGGMGEVGYPL